MGSKQTQKKSDRRDSKAAHVHQVSSALYFLRLILHVGNQKKGLESVKGLRATVSLPSHTTNICPSSVDHASQALSLTSKALLLFCILDSLCLLAISQDVTALSVPIVLLECTHIGVIRAPAQFLSSGISRRLDLVQELPGFVKLVRQVRFNLFRMSTLSLLAATPPRVEVRLHHIRRSYRLVTSFSFHGGTASEPSRR